MVDILGTVELKSGEQMEIVRVVPPESAWKDRILPFLGHKGQPWQWQMEIAFDQGLEGAKQYYYEGVVDGQIVGNIMTIESMDPPIGILGHVFTPPEQRRKGICSHLMEALTEDFRARSGRAMFLHTGYDTPPYHIYASWGFVGYRETGTMAWVLEDDFVGRQFEPRPVEVRETNWGDWAALEALSEINRGWHLRSVWLGIYGFGGFEGQYVQVRRAMHEGRVSDFRVLASEDGAVMGYALLARYSNFPGKPLVLDLFTHPAYIESAEELARAIELPDDERVIAFADSASRGKPQALEAAGLQQQAKLPCALTDDEGSALDLIIFSRR
jgi:GNAT superfamily N-acetyltransferase